MVRFPAINLRLHSVHAANESWEGLNLLAWVMDEASAFRAAGGNADNSGAVYGTLRTSANSRFASMRWVGIIISFPRKQVNDFTFEKYKDAQTSPTMYGDTGATWDINPQYDPTHPLFKNFEWVTIEELNVRVPKPFVEEFLKDPTDCKTKYMCEPPPQVGGFFEIPMKLDQCVDRNLPQIVATSQLVRREVRGMQFDYVSRLVDQVPTRVEGADYFLHGDPGLMNDAFSVCVCHTLPEEKWVVDLETGIERKVVVDFVLNWERCDGWDCSGRKLFRGCRQRDPPRRESPIAGRGTRARVLGRLPSRTLWRGRDCLLAPRAREFGEHWPTSHLSCNLLDGTRDEVRRDVPSAAPAGRQAVRRARRPQERLDDPS